MKKPSQSLQLALVVVALAAVAAAGYFLLIAPKRESAAETEELVQTTQAQVDARRTAALSPAAPLAPAVDAAELFRLTKAMPNDADMAEAILELDRIATDTGIVFDALTPRPEVAASGYRVLPIDLAFNGNFYNLSDFLFRLRSLVAVRDGKLVANGRLLDVESVSFAAGPAGFPQLTATVLVNAYVYEAGAAASTPGTPPAEIPLTASPEASAAGAS